MNELTGNEPINPSYDKDGVRHQGLTIRQYYAGLAMQAFISSMTEKAAIGAWGTEQDQIAKYSTDQADELIKALNL